MTQEETPHEEPGSRLAEWPGNREKLRERQEATVQTKRLRTREQVEEYLAGRPAMLRIPVMDTGGSCLDYVVFEMDPENTAKLLGEAVRQSPYELELWAAVDEAGAVTAELRDKSDWEEDGGRWKP